jgi:uncharacterized protein with ParB-like and HNH nuclease domain
MKSYHKNKSNFYEKQYHVSIIFVCNYKEDLLFWNEISKRMKNVNYKSEICYAPVTPLQLQLLNLPY